MRKTIAVHLGSAARLVGHLRFLAEGNRQAASFSYDESWLRAPDRFTIDPALPLVEGPQFHRKANHDHASVFFGCIADSEPDGWGVQVIRRDHAKRRKDAEARGDKFDPRPMNDLDFLLSVDDVSRVGALRYMDESGEFVRATKPGDRSAPPLIELRHLLAATRAIETNTETSNDLAYLRGRGTSLGGMRPKCSVIDEDGVLSIGKFPSVHDTREVTRGEVLALRLAAMAGIRAAAARVVMSDDTPVALIRRFDRVGEKRLSYLSARTMLGVDDAADHAYTEIVEAIRVHGSSVTSDLEELWRRIVFTILVTNVDDHLNNHGVLHTGEGKWRLSPAFDVNPFPDKARSLKTWISEESGPDAGIEPAVAAARFFGIKPDRAQTILGEVLNAVQQWRDVARTAEVGMTARECEDFENAFEHEETSVASRIVSRTTAPTPSGRRRGGQGSSGKRPDVDNPTSAIDVVETPAPPGIPI